LKKLVRVKGIEPSS